MQHFPRHIHIFEKYRESVGTNVREIPSADNLIAFKCVYFHQKYDRYIVQWTNRKAIGTGLTGIQIRSCFLLM